MEDTPGIQNKKEKERRRFLKLCLGTTMGGLALAAVYPVIKYIKVGDSSAGKNYMNHSFSTRAMLLEKDLKEQKSILVELKGKPVIVIVTEDGYRAFSAICTHLACIVKWQPGKNEFICPCHKARFSVEGKVLSGPPPAPLKEVPVTVDNEKIIIGGI